MKLGLCSMAARKPRVFTVFTDLFGITTGIASAQQHDGRSARRWRTFVRQRLALAERSPRQQCTLEAQSASMVPCSALLKAGLKYVLILKRTIFSLEICCRDCSTVKPFS